MSFLFGTLLGVVIGVLFSAPIVSYLAKHKAKAEVLTQMLKGAAIDALKVDEDTLIDHKTAKAKKARDRAQKELEKAEKAALKAAAK